MSKEDISQKSEELVNQIDPDFKSKIMKDNNYKAKLIASYIRNNMEDFHANYLSDEQMKELNPLIRNAIYTALIDVEENLSKAYIQNKFYVPEYWEDCEYISSL